MVHESNQASSSTRREFIDDDGTVWRASEVPAAHIPGSRGARCLIFDSERVCRRLWNYPSNWYELSDTTLAALNHRERQSALRRETATTERRGRAHWPTVEGGA